jgi:RIO-like serine/threonine protein kinase
LIDKGRKVYVTESDVDAIVDLQFRKRQRINNRPPRFLSRTSNTESQKLALLDQHLVKGLDFFFELDDSVKNFQCDAFKGVGPETTEDENSVHHKYFIDQIEILVDSAKNAGITLNQQIYWSRKGEWLTLDDATTSNTGCEPDFCMTAVKDAELIAPKTVKAPSSKYEVTVAMEMKKTYADSHLSQALDYGERLLSVQRGRKSVYSALFHCNQHEQLIRWLKVEVVENGTKFKTSVSKPYRLAEDGQKQLLTIMSMQSAGLGLDYPEYNVKNTNEVVQIKYLIGEGATSIVYAAQTTNKIGVIKCLQNDYSSLAKIELNLLNRLEKSKVPWIPSPVEEITDGVLFFTEELAPLYQLNKGQASELIDCLQGAHKVGIIHRDVRPDNIMQDMQGHVRLIDWGFASSKGDTNVPFQGTFRYASQEVLLAAISETARGPQPKDDLHSALRIILSSLQPSISNDLAKIEDLQGVLDYWTDKRKKNRKYEWAFVAADECNYDDLKLLYFDN